MIEYCKKIRREVLQASFDAGACHLGSALSCIEIMAVLFKKIKTAEDFFLFSKASGSIVYYRMLGHKGKKLVEYIKQYPLSSKEVPGVPYSTGSLGMGLSVAVGVAVANPKQKVYCLISDGELDEGNTWEAIKFAGKHDLENLTCIVDYNKITACQKTEIDPHVFSDFDWAMIEVKGNDTKEIEWGLSKYESPAPKMIVAHTTKGKGVSFMENKIEWHYKNLDEGLLNKALKENEKAI